MFRVPEHLYWTADKARLVRRGHVDAAFLAFTEGQEIPDEEARRVGLVESAPEPAPEPEKARAKAPNKAVGQPANKTAPAKPGPAEDVQP